MKQIVVGVFDRYESARHAADLLADSGFGPESVHLTDSSYGDAVPVSDTVSAQEGRAVMESIRSFFAEVFGSEHGQHASEYAEAVRRGGAVVKVDVGDEPRLDVAREVLQAAGAVNIDERAAEWRRQGWSGEMDVRQFEREREAGALGTHASAGTAATPSDASSVGITRTGADADHEERAAAGGVRVYSHAAPDPRQASLELREQPAAARDTVVERETRGDARAATPPRPRRSYDEDADEFRSDHATNYETLGGSYEDYEPAYRYGHMLGSEPRYAGRTWNQLEGDARSEWQRRHPGSSWERFKAAVRRGWERMTE